MPLGEMGATREEKIWVHCFARVWFFSSKNPSNGFEPTGNGKRGHICARGPESSSITQFSNYFSTVHLLGFLRGATRVMCPYWLVTAAASRRSNLFNRC